MIITLLALLIDIIDIEKKKLLFDIKYNIVHEIGTLCLLFLRYRAGIFEGLNCHFF